MSAFASKADISRFVSTSPSLLRRKIRYARSNARGSGMKRYLIFAALGPLIGGFLLLFATTYMSGYWTHTDLSEGAKLFVVFAKTLQYSYLFGLLPALMMAAVDDILFHVKRIRPVFRMLIVGALAFVGAELLYGSAAAESGGRPVILFWRVGLC